MPRQSKKRAPKKKSAPKKTSRTTKTSRRTPQKQTSPPQPPPKIIIRNARHAPAVVDDDDERNAFGDRLEEMGGSHVAAGVGAGTLGTALGVTLVGKGWIGPKLTAGLLAGTGLAASAAGYYWDADHLMAAGAGLAAAGTFSLANQYAIDTYEALEKKAKEKRKKTAEAVAEKEERDRVEAARETLAEDGKRRNGRRLVIVDSDGTMTELVEQLEDQEEQDSDNAAA